MINDFEHSACCSRVKETQYLRGPQRQRDTPAAQAGVVHTAVDVATSTMEVVALVRWWAFPQSLLMWALLLARASSTGSLKTVCFGVWGVEALAYLALSLDSGSGLHTAWGEEVVQIAKHSLLASALSSGRGAFALSANSGIYPDMMQR